MSTKIGLAQGGTNADLSATGGTSRVLKQVTAGADITVGQLSAVSDISGLAVASGKTFTVSNTLTISGTDGSSLAIGAGGTLGTAAYTATSAYLPTASPSATGLLTVTGTAQSGSSATGAVSITQSLNTSGAPVVFGVNITNTASGAGTALIAAQISGSSIFAVRQTGQILIGTGSASMYPANPSSYGADVTSGSLRLAYANPTATVGYSLIFKHALVAGTTQTSGSNGVMIFTDGYAPTSGSGTWTGVTLLGEINQTGGASGITRGFWAANTITAAADYRAFQADNNSGYGIAQTGASAKNYFNGITGIGAVPTTDKLEVTGNISLMSAGNKIKIATGSNASVGTATLVTGTVTVATTAAATASKIFVTVVTPGGTQGFLSVPTIVNGTSFTINSTSGTETSTVNWWIVN